MAIRIRHEPASSLVGDIAFLAGLGQGRERRGNEANRLQALAAQLAARREDSAAGRALQREQAIADREFRGEQAGLQRDFVLQDREAARAGDLDRLNLQAELQGERAVQQQQIRREELDFASQQQYDRLLTGRQKVLTDPVWTGNPAGQREALRRIDMAMTGLSANSIAPEPPPSPAEMYAQTAHALEDGRVVVYDQKGNPHWSMPPKASVDDGAAQALEAAEKERERIEKQREAEVKVMEARRKENASRRATAIKELTVEHDDGSIATPTQEQVDAYVGLMETPEERAEGRAEGGAERRAASDAAFAEHVAAMQAQGDKNYLNAIGEGREDQYIAERARAKVAELVSFGRVDAADSDLVIRNILAARNGNEQSQRVLDTMGVPWRD